MYSARIRARSATAASQSNVRRTRLRQLPPFVIGRPYTGGRARWTWITERTDGWTGETTRRGGGGRYAAALRLRLASRRTVVYVASARTDPAQRLSASQRSPDASPFRIAFPTIGNKLPFGRNLRLFYRPDRMWSDVDRRAFD